MQAPTFHSSENHFAWTGLLICSIVACQVPQAPAQTSDKQKAQALYIKHVQASTNQYVQPQFIPIAPPAAARPTILEVKLATVDVEHPLMKNGEPVLEQGRLVIVKNKLLVRTYNGQLIAQGIRVAPGDVLKINLKNSIPKTLPDVPANKNKPNGFNITNLHTHGLHVSPEGRSDNVYLEVGPEESCDLCFDIPANHIPGTFWFHPHRHGSTGLQLSSGMAGALIVDPGSAGGIDDVLEIKAAMKDGREKILVFQQLRYSLRPDGVGEVTPQDVYGNNPDTIAVTLVNGKFAPQINMQPGEVQRWRCIHSGIDSTLQLTIGTDAGNGDLGNKWDLHEIAEDGIPLAKMTAQKGVELQPGYRSDFLVQAPSNPGDYILASGPVSAARALRKAPQALIPLARISVAGNALPMGLPNPDAITKYSPPPVDDKELFNRIPYKLEFYAAGGSNPQYTINGQSFDRDRVDLCPRVGTAEEWALTSAADRHPFHIHVNPFEVVRKDNQGNITSRVWKDTIFFTDDDDGPTYVRMRFQDFPGKTVLHCHNLAHEDQGMMMAISLVGKPSPATRCDPKKPPGMSSLPVKAPAWALQDFRGRIHRADEFLGRSHILVLFRGFACGHCRRQLELMQKYCNAWGFDKQDIVAICPDSVQDIKETIKDDTSAQDLPFLVLSDPSLEVFRKHGCHDGRALHGTFLVTAQGQIIWQYAGDQPFMDIEELLYRFRKLTSQSASDGGKATGQR